MVQATIRTRRDTAANWTTANPILGLGEEGFETDTGKSKKGDGTNHWASLSYVTGGGGGGGGDVAGDTHAAAEKSTPIDADELPLVDTAASNGLKKVTLADLKTAIRQVLNSVAAPTGDVSMASHKIINVTNPTSAQDAATKDYTDTGLAAKLTSTGLKSAVETAFPKVMMMNVYSSGWTIDSTLQADANVAWHFVGGTTGTPPPSTTGPSVWDHA